MTNKRNRTQMALAVLVISAPAFLTFLYVASFGVNVAYYDQWGYVPLVEKLFTHRLSIDDLLRPVNDHIIATSKFVSLTSAYLTQWNSMTELWTGYVLQLATCVIVFIMYWSKRPKQSSLPLQILGFLPFSVLIFSLRQWENSLAVWSVSLFGVNCFVLLTLLLLEKSGYRRFIFAILTAILASLTLMNGFLVWPLALLIMLAGLLERDLDTKSVRRLKIQISIWVVLALMLVLLRLLIYPLARQASPAGVGWTSIIKRFLLALSVPLAFDKEMITAASISVVTEFDIQFMLLLGGVLTTVFLVTLYAVRRRESFAENRLYLAISLFGLGSAALVALGRYSFGTQQALSPRYATLCSMFLVGMLLLLRNLSFKDGRWKVFLIPLITLVLFINAYADLAEWNVGRYRRANNVNWAHTIRNYATATDEQLKNPHFSPQQIRDWSAIMERYELNVFSNRRVDARK